MNALSDDEDETEAIEQDEEDGTFGDEMGRAARALYAFEGKPEFRELTSVQAGDMLEVLREDVGDGWSLVKSLGGPEGHTEVGLIPQTYYAVKSYHFLIVDELTCEQSSLLHSSLPTSRMHPI